ncbi:hypothetical protein LTR17_026450 [Elasticomyces elasticus]|nr:hypothetical protein LTR17_026450 [Elasticomyces elasticus]
MAPYADQIVGHQQPSAKRRKVDAGLNDEVKDRNITPNGGASPEHWRKLLKVARANTCRRGAGDRDVPGRGEYNAENVMENMKNRRGLFQPLGLLDSAEIAQLEREFSAFSAAPEGEENKFKSWMACWTNGAFEETFSNALISILTTGSVSKSGGFDDYPKCAGIYDPQKRCNVPVLLTREWLIFTLLVPVLLRTDTPVLWCVTGIPGIGKTWWLEFFISYLMQRLDAPAVFRLTKVGLDVYMLTPEGVTIRSCCDIKQAGRFIRSLRVLKTKTIVLYDNADFPPESTAISLHPLLEWFYGRASMLLTSAPGGRGLAGVKQDSTDRDVRKLFMEHPSMEEVAFMVKQLAATEHYCTENAVEMGLEFGFVPRYCVDFCYNDSAGKVRDHRDLLEEKYELAATEPSALTDMSRERKPSEEEGTRGLDHLCNVLRVRPDDVEIKSRACDKAMVAAGDANSASDTVFWSTALLVLCSDQANFRETCWKNTPIANTVRFRVGESDYQRLQQTLGLSGSIPEADPYKAVS